MTLRQHYYPEGGWGWIVVIVAFIVQCISHGLHLSLGIFINQVVKEFHQDYFHAGYYHLLWCHQFNTKIKFFLNYLL